MAEKGLPSAETMKVFSTDFHKGQLKEKPEEPLKDARGPSLIAFDNSWYMFERSLAFAAMKRKEIPRCEYICIVIAALDSLGIKILFEVRSL